MLRQATERSLPEALPRYGHKTMVFAFRVLLLCGLRIVSSYEIREFNKKPGIYFEKIGEYCRVESTWKVAVRVDIRAINERHDQLRELIKDVQQYCRELEYLDGVAKMVCNSMVALIKKEEGQLNRMITRVRSLSSEVKEKKRGLIDGVGSLAKYLFGVMDAGDEKIVNDHLSALDTEQGILESAVKNQLQVLNKTVVHLNKLEEKLQYNENVLLNVTRRLGMALDGYAQREFLSEYFATINAVMADLLRDAEQIIEFALHLKRGIVHPAVVPQEVVLAQLKEAVSKLPEGVHFPFQVAEQYWPVIEKFGEVVAYVRGTEIIVVLKFPLVSYPESELVRVLPLPVHSHDNVYVFADVKHSLISVDKERKTYSVLSTEELRNRCKTLSGRYFCDHSLVTYYVNGGSPCEVRMFLRENGAGCDLSYLITDQTLWIALENSFVFLYSAHTSEQIIVQCRGHTEFATTVRGTGQVALTEDCKLLTQELYIKTKGTAVSTQVQVYIPEYNLSLPVVTPTQMKNLTGVKLKPVMNGKELSRVSDKINDIATNVNNVHPIWSIHPRIAYTVSISSVLFIIVIIITCFFIKYIFKKREIVKTRASVENVDHVRSVLGQA